VLHQPATVEQAVALAAQHANAKYLAGGTDLVVNMRRRIAEPEHVIALGGIGSLRGIAHEGGSLVIGSGTTLAEIAANEEVRARLPVLAEAAGIVAGPTIRKMATLGGNLTLDTRCRYYNQTFFWRQANDFCLKKDGTVCHVAPGGSFCWAAFSGDTPPALLILGAELEIAGPKGLRRQPLSGFYGKDGRWSIGTAEFLADGGLAPGELIVRARVPIPGPDFEAVYEKLRVRDSIDYPLVGVALGVRWKDRQARLVGEIRMALTAVNPRPELVKGTEELPGQTFDLDIAEALGRLAHRTGKPMRTTTADPAYRRSMITALVQKAAVRLAPELREAMERKARWA
jgi:4-hydroxybenzoyl-CoA reductase subunit beta